MESSRFPARGRRACWPTTPSIGTRLARLKAGCGGPARGHGGYHVPGHMRDWLSLDGDWQARVDPSDTGLADGWDDPRVPFDRTLRVPLPWQAADPNLRQYAGVVWYRRSFQVPSAWRGTGSIRVRFGAVDYDAQVWLNGHAVGGHLGGYAPFEVDLTPFLNWSGDNWLALRVFDPPVLDEVPHGKQGGRWYTAVSGPWQSVTLVVRPATRVARIRCYPDALHGSVRTQVRCEFHDSTQDPLTLQVSVLDSASLALGQATALVGSQVPDALLEVHMAGAQRWSPAAPHLHTLHARLTTPTGEVVDELDERFGLRTIETRDGRLFLNGEPLYLRGALDQAYWPDSLYSLPSDAAIERELDLARGMGLNLLRKHVKPEDPRYLDACDRSGMLVWSEPAHTESGSRTAREAVRRDLLEMIDRDFNRPSIIIWSLYNEDWGLPGLWSTAEHQAWLRDLYAEVKALDPTRLVCDNSGWAHVQTDLNDYHEYYAVPERLRPLRSRLDFIAQHPEDNYVRGVAPGGHEPILLSEWGNWALTNPEQARQRSGGKTPAWFAYDRGYARATDGPITAPENPLTERIKTIDGFVERFHELRLDEVFDSPSALIEHIQQRAFRSLKAQIEEMRRRPELQGWVVTELCDQEWEANGWLDYWREPKLFYSDLADVNAPVAVIAQPQRASTWGGEQVVLDVTLSNTTARPVSGVLRWRLAGTDVSGEIPAEAPPFGNARIPGGVRLVAPHETPRANRVDIELVDGDRRLARTYAEIAFAPRGAALEHVDANGYQLDRVLRQRLERNGYVIPRSFDPSVRLAIAVRLDELTLDYLNEGGRVLYLAGDAGEGGALAGLRFTTLSAGESWRMAAGVGWARVDRLAPAPLRPGLGWEAADIFPTLGIDAGCLQPEDDQFAGWFEGWLANGSVFALRRRVGRGHLLATTFRFADTYGLDPVATLLLNRLAALLLGA